MNMITEAEFTAAMEKAVKWRGEDWRFPMNTSEPGFYHKGIPTYSDQGGTPTCLIGAAMAELRMRVPEYGSGGSALSVLATKVPYDVLIAARCAQIHQDRSKPWGEALEVYRLALTMAKKQDVSVFTVGDFYDQVVGEAKAHRAVTNGVITAADLENVQTQMHKIADAFAAIKMPTLYIPKFSTGGWCAPSDQVFTWGDQITVTIDASTASPELVSAMTAMAMKKDHALTA